MSATILGIPWRQGYGFDETDEHRSTWRTHQAAYGRLRRAKRALSDESLDDWAIQASVEPKTMPDGSRRWVLTASLYEIC